MASGALLNQPISRLVGGIATGLLPVGYNLLNTANQAYRIYRTANRERRNWQRYAADPSPNRTMNVTSLVPFIPRNYSRYRKRSFGRTKYGRRYKRQRSGLIYARPDYKVLTHKVYEASPQYISDSWALMQFTCDTSTGACVPRIIPGNEIGARDSRRIFVKKFRFRGCIVNTDTTAKQVRLVFFQDKQTNGATPATSTVMASAATRDILGFESTAAFGKIRIWKDFQVVCAESASTDEPGSTRVDFTVKFNRPICIHYDGDDSTVGSIIDNSWYLMCCSSTACSSTLYLLGNIRVYFTC